MTRTNRRRVNPGVLTSRRSSQGSRIMTATSIGRIVVPSLALVAACGAALVFGITHLRREPPVETRAAATAGAAVAAALVSTGGSRRRCVMPKTSAAPHAATSARDGTTIRPIDVAVIIRDPCRGGGLIVPSDGFLMAYRKSIIQLAAQYRVPTIYGIRAFSAEGVLVS